MGNRITEKSERVAYNSKKVFTEQSERVIFERKKVTSDLCDILVVKGVEGDHPLPTSVQIALKGAEPVHFEARDIALLVSQLQRVQVILFGASPVPPPANGKVSIPLPIARTQSGRARMGGLIRASKVRRERHVAPLGGDQILGTILDLRNEGMRYKEIADYLNEMKVPPPEQATVAGKWLDYHVKQRLYGQVSERGGVRHPETDRRLSETTRARLLAGQGIVPEGISKEE